MGEEKKFSFEDLRVWQKATDFADKILAVCEDIQSTRKHWRLTENLEASAMSIPSNIAEGKGRYSKKEFVQYLFVARGSLYETITALIVFHRRHWVTDVVLNELKRDAEEINKMISSLVCAVREKNPVHDLKNLKTKTRFFAQQLN